MSLFSPFAASAQTVIVPRSDWTTPYTLGVNTNKNNSAYGQISVVVGGVTYPINSTFSYPASPAGKWNGFPAPSTKESGWKINVQTVTANQYFVITAKGAHYSVNRTVRKNGNRVDVTDLFQKIGSSNVGIMMKNYARLPSAQVNSGAVVLGGIPLSKADLKVSNALYVNTRGDNSTFFAAYGAVGIGIYAADGVYRAHAKEKLEVGATADGGVVDEDFLLPAGTSYTRTWSIYPVIGDYFDFINRVRRDLNVNYLLDGTSITLNLLDASGSGYLALRTGQYMDFWNDDLAAYFDKIGAKYVIAAQSVTPDGRMAFGSSFVNEVAANEQDRLRRIVDRIHTTAPGIEVLFYMDRWLTTESGALATYPDSKIAYDTAGTLYQGTLQRADGSPYPLYGMRNDPAVSYNAALQPYVSKALSLGFDGIFFDEMDGLTALSTIHPLRFFPVANYTSATDTHSTDIHPTTFAAAARKLLLSLEGKATEIALVNRLTAEGKFMMANGGSPLTTPDVRFTHVNEITPDPTAFFGPFYEAQAGYSHLSTPVVYSHDGDDAGIASSIRKYLSVGSLYNYGYVPFFLNQNVMQKMYPLTPMELHSGYVIGQERMITTLSGEYGYNDTSALTAFVYDANGYLLLTNSQNYVSNGRTFISIRLQSDQVAVIEKN